MSIGSILLRLMLCLSLVLSGPGMAAGAAHPQAMHATDAGTAGTGHAQADGAALPCHRHANTQHSGTQHAGMQHPGMQLAGMQHAGMDAARATVPDTGSPAGNPTPDCCGSGACTCACMQAAQAALPSIRAPLVAGSEVPPIPLAAGHAAPTLRHLIRPPIG